MYCKSQFVYICRISALGRPKPDRYNSQMLGRQDHKLWTLPFHVWILMGCCNLCEWLRIYCVGYVNFATRAERVTKRQKAGPVSVVEDCTAVTGYEPPFFVVGCWIPSADSQLPPALFCSSPVDLDMSACQDCALYYWQALLFAFWKESARIAEVLEELQVLWPAFKTCQSRMYYW